MALTTNKLTDTSTSSSDASPPAPAAPTPATAATWQKLAALAQRIARDLNTDDLAVLNAAVAELRTASESAAPPTPANTDSSGPAPAA